MASTKMFQNRSTNLHSTTKMPLNSDFHSIANREGRTRNAASPAVHPGT